MTFSHRLINVLTAASMLGILFFDTHYSSGHYSNGIDTSINFLLFTIDDFLYPALLSILFTSTLSYLLGIGFQPWHRQKKPDEG